MTRRTIIVVAIAAALALVAVAVLVAGRGLWPPSLLGSADAIRPGDAAVAQAEAARRSPTAETVQVRLTAAPTTITVGGRRVSTWAFNEQVPGPRIIARPGDLVRAEVINQLPQPLTVHWHGIALRNDMDGVPDLTQRPIAPGERFTYEFTVPDPGSYFYHSHVGVQLDRGLYGPLIVTDPPDPATADVTLLLDDWIDGTGTTPDQVLADLIAGTGMHTGDTGGPGPMGMDHSGMAGMGGIGSSGMTGADPQHPLGLDASDMAYPMYLINGRAAGAPWVARPVRPGQPMRVRLINAGSATPFRVAVSRGRMTVVASDGFGVQPVAADSLLLGMGERYDVVVTAPRRGSLWLFAQPEGSQDTVPAALSTDSTASPPPRPPAALAQPPLPLSRLSATTAADLGDRTPDRSYDLTLTGGMMDYRWGIDTGGADLTLRQGDRVQLTIRNATMMWHPIHLHGHTFQVVDGGWRGPRKDTVSLPPMTSITVVFDADNPGQWMLHCHATYHAAAGMTTELSYRS